MGIRRSKAKANDRPTRCAVCQHDDVREINSRLVKPKASTRKIGEVFNLHYKAVERHRDNHLPAALQEIVNETAVQELMAETLPDASPQEQVKALTIRAQVILDETHRKKDYSSATRALREVRGCIELMAKLAGEIDAGTTITIINNPSWITLQTNILTALDAYPEARAAVVRALAVP